MQDEDRAFDFITAMENSTNQLNEFVATLPGVVGSELRRSADFVGLARVVAEANTTVAATNAAVANVNTAADDANNAAATLRRASYYALIAVVVACLVFMGATWAVTWWQTEKRRAEAAEWKAEAEEWRAEAEEQQERFAALSATVEVLKDKTGGGVELVTYKDGTRAVILPAGSKITRSGKMPDGRAAVMY